MLNQNNLHLLMTGGGTLGPVTPLIALAEHWRQIDPAVKVSWIGTPKGPEKKLVEESQINFLSLSAPKLDRFRIWLWILIIPHLIYSIIKAFFIVKKIKPDIVFTAGGYVSLPVVIAAFFLGKPCWVHQLDVKAGLANKLMSPFAKRISVTWPASVRSFPKRKTIIVGGLIRQNLEQGNGSRLKQKYHLDLHRPTMLLIGGGTGAASLNEAIAAVAPEVAMKINVIHLTGIGKMPVGLAGIKNYIALEFMTKEMADAYDAADFVVARSGMGTILELAALGKPSILVPIQDSHQVFNAHELSRQQAAIVIDRLTPQVLKQEILQLESNLSLRIKLADHINKVFSMNAAQVIVDEAKSLIWKS